jgi:hypothetical protein
LIRIDLPQQRALGIQEGLLRFRDLGRVHLVCLKHFKKSAQVLFQSDNILPSILISDLFRQQSVKTTGGNTRNTRCTSPCGGWSPGILWRRKGTGRDPRVMSLLE